MYLEKLPKADNKFKKIHNVNFFENRAELRVDKDYIFDIELKTWFDVFKEFYNDKNKSNYNPESISGPQMEDLLIEEFGKTPVINFRVDWSHCALKFFYNSEDKKALSLVEGFIEKLI